MAVPARVMELVERFERNREAYRAGLYNETQVRREFIDPLLEALGWDVDNKQGYAEAYKDVIHEDAIRVAGEHKAPDYSCRIGGQRKFFVEAKKPAVNIREDISPAYQLRRYGWSAKLPLSILTDFEEFAVYDCRIRPEKTDKASQARILYWRYTDYLTKWDELAAIFSPEAIRKGSFDKFAQEKKAQRGTAEVDTAFLQDISAWRQALAENIALRNRDRKLKSRQLSHAVQSTIDRIVFLRIAEDRGIEPYRRLYNLTEGKDIYQRLVAYFQQADAKYNAGLFHFRPEKGRDDSSLDTFTLTLAIDDKILRDMIRGLYYPDSPYQFDMIPADILGQVYEQFLGKVIRLTVRGQAKIEDKPEVKKAGGVYYTPTYIVSYIVQQTVGKLLEGKKVGPQGEASKLRILDPACGSGSFLIGAYQYLLDWHLQAYSQEPDKWRRGRNPTLYQSAAGYRLTLPERKRILLDNLYGVDIDPQAVEVTKLSLLLKVLEGETDQTIATQMSLFPERILPDLGRNIQCGNSLIGPDYYSQTGQLPLFDEEEAYRVNVFDWNAAFPAIMAAGGFDAVIGNPPYVRQELLVGAKNYLQSRYAVYQGGADLYAYFIEKGLLLLKDRGYFAYIVANKWLRADYGTPLRVWLKSHKIIEILDFGDLPVFEKATTYPCIIVIQRDIPNTFFDVALVNRLDFTDLSIYVQENKHPVNQSQLRSDGWSLVDDQTKKLLDKVENLGVRFSDFLQGEIVRGVLSGSDQVFVIDKETRDYLIEKDPRSVEVIKPALAGRDVQRYRILNNQRFLIFTRRGINLQKYPAIEEYLTRYKHKLMPKPKNWKGATWEGRKEGAYQWYEIQDAVDYYELLEKPKLVYLKFQVKPAFAFDHSGFYPNSAVWVIPKDDKYLLGILNSKMGWFLISNYCTQIQNGYQLIYKYMRNIPIPALNLENPLDGEKYDKFVARVDQMLALQKQLVEVAIPHEKAILQRQIEATDRQIDRLVYELYELTPEEIAIVEGGR